MPTRFYFHNATSALSGTFPTGEQSAATANVTAAGAATMRVMDLTIGAGQSTMNFTTDASTNARNNFLRTFVSPPLVGDQVVGGGNMILNAAEQQSNNNANFWINSCCVYVWRPSTGTKVGNVRDAAGTSLGGSEPSAANSTQVSHITAITTSAVNALNGDVVICEIWTRTTQGQATGYTALFQYDGTTINTTENAVVTNHASFLELNENLNFTPLGFDPMGMMGFFGI
jgi:hypothetical protein